MWFFILDSGFSIYSKSTSLFQGSWPQQWTKPRPVNIFLQRAERRHGCPAQAIPGSSISMSFQPYQVLPHSKPSYSEFRRCVQSKHARRVADNEAGKVGVRREGAQRIRRVKTGSNTLEGFWRTVSGREGAHIKRQFRTIQSRGWTWPRPSTTFLGRRLLWDRDKHSPTPTYQTADTPLLCW